MSKTTSDKNETGPNGEFLQPARRFEDLPPAAQRALREAEERRAQIAAMEAGQQREIGGRGGKDPARYGDWEVKGVAVDF